MIRKIATVVATAATATILGGTFNPAVASDNHPLPDMAPPCKTAEGAGQRTCARDANDYGGGPSYVMMKRHGKRHYVKVSHRKADALISKWRRNNCDTVQDGRLVCIGWKGGPPKKKPPYTGGKPYGGCKEAYLEPKSEGANWCRSRGWTITAMVVFGPRGYLRYSQYAPCWQIDTYEAECVYDAGRRDGPGHTGFWRDKETQAHYAARPATPKGS